jgi:flagellar biogenesis protein FliO
MTLNFPALNIWPLLALLWQQGGTPPFEPTTYGSGASFLVMLLQTFLALGLVCGLAYLIFRGVLPRLGATPSNNSMVRIVDRIGLDARKSLYVVEVTGRWLLIASSEAGVQLVSELDAERAEEAAAEVERLRPTFRKMSDTARVAFADRLAQLMNRKR